LFKFFKPTCTLTPSQIDSVVLMNPVSRPGYRMNNEKKLISDLFHSYQVKFGRPVNNMSENIVVHFGIALIQLIDLVIEICSFYLAQKKF